MKSILTILFLACIITSCGGKSNEGGADKYPPPSPPSDKWLAVQPIVNRVCVKCHDGKIQNPDFRIEANFKNSTAKARIENGSMPKNAVLSPEDKAALLSYFSASN